VNAFSPPLEQSLRAHARVLRLSKKETLFTYGAPPDGLYCLQKGILRLSVTASNGREAVLSVMQPGRWFGEASLLSGEPHVHDARAVTDCEVLMIPAESVQKVPARSRRLSAGADTLGMHPIPAITPAYRCFDSPSAAGTIGKTAFRGQKGAVSAYFRS